MAAVGSALASGFQKLTKNDFLLSSKSLKLMFQKDMITLTVAVEFNGYVVVIPALSLRYKHQESVPDMQLLASTSLTYTK